MVNVTHSAALPLLLVISAAVENCGPTAVSKPAPEYSDLARRAGVEGTVLLRATVGPQGGAPTKVEVTRQLGWGLDEEAVKAVSHWEFRAAKSNGELAECTANVECHFSGPSIGPLRFGAMAFQLTPGVSKPVLTAFFSPDTATIDHPTKATGKIDFIVNELGLPINFHVESESSSESEADKAVLAALRLWQFSPATRNRQPVSVQGSVEFTSVGRK